MFDNEPSDADLLAIESAQWGDDDILDMPDDDDFDVDAYAEWYQEQLDYPEDWS
jgi:hypothetical protein